MRLSVKMESTIIDVFNSKNWNICCCGSEKRALSHGVGVSQGPVHDCTARNASALGIVNITLATVLNKLDTEQQLPI